MKDPDRKTDTAFDLGRYRQAADVAYRYAKSKIEKERFPKSDDEDVLSSKEKSNF